MSDIIGEEKQKKSLPCDDAIILERVKENISMVDEPIAFKKIHENVRTEKIEEFLEIGEIPNEKSSKSTLIQEEKTTLNDLSSTLDNLPSDMKIALSYADADIDAISNVISDLTKPPVFIKTLKEPPVDSSSYSEEECSTDEEEDSDIEVDKSKWERKEQVFEEDEDGLTNENPISEHELAVPIIIANVTLDKSSPIEKIGILLNLNTSEKTVVVRSDSSSQILDEKSVLCFEDRSILGCVEDIFGPVAAPLYLVRYSGEISTMATDGVTIYYAKEHTSYVPPEKISKNKGTDSSNMYDEEPRADELEFSDDEAEAAAKAAKKAKRKRNSVQQRNENSIPNIHHTPSNTKVHGNAAIRSPREQSMYKMPNYASGNHFHPSNPPYPPNYYNQQQQMYPQHHQMYPQQQQQQQQPIHQHQQHHMYPSQSPYYGQFMGQYQYPPGPVYPNYPPNPYMSGHFHGHGNNPPPPQPGQYQDSRYYHSSQERTPRQANHNRK